MAITDLQTKDQAQIRTLEQSLQDTERDRAKCAEELSETRRILCRLAYVENNPDRNQLSLPFLCQDVIDNFQHLLKKAQHDHEQSESRCKHRGEVYSKLYTELEMIRPTFEQLVKAKNRAEVEAEGFRERLDENSQRSGAQ